MPANSYITQTPLWERDIFEEMRDFKPPSADLLEVQESLSKPSPFENPIESLLTSKQPSQHQEVKQSTPPAISPKLESKKPIGEDLFKFTQQAPAKITLDPFEPSAPQLSPKLPATETTKRDAIDDFLKASQAHSEQSRGDDFFDPEVNMEQKDEEGKDEEFSHGLAPPFETTKKEMDSLAAPMSAPQPPKPAPHSALDDFDAELEQQLAAFNIGGRSGPSHNTDILAGFQPSVASSKKSADLGDDDGDDGWGDEDDEDQFN